MMGVQDVWTYQGSKEDQTQPLTRTYSTLFWFEQSGQDAWAAKPNDEAKLGHTLRSIQVTLCGGPLKLAFERRTNFWSIINIHKFWR